MPRETENSCHEPARRNVKAYDFGRCSSVYKIPGSTGRNEREIRERRSEEQLSICERMRIAQEEEFRYLEEMGATKPNLMVNKEGIFVLISRKGRWTVQLKEHLNRCLTCENVRMEKKPPPKQANLMPFRGGKEKLRLLLWMFQPSQPQAEKDTQKCCQYFRVSFSAWGCD